MATFDGSDLKAWRKSLGIPAEVLAERISCDVTTIFRYESGKLHPDPDVMYQICRELGDTRKWHDWMRTEYPRSFGKEYPSPVTYDIPGSILSLYSICHDIDRLKHEIFSDAADGSIDNVHLRREITSIFDKLFSTGQAIKSMLPDT